MFNRDQVLKRGVCGRSTASCYFVGRFQRFRGGDFWRCYRHAVECNRPRNGSSTPKSHLAGDAASFGAKEATICSKRGSPRSGSQKGNSLSMPELVANLCGGFKT